MIDVEDIIFRPVARGALVIARALLWLGWDVFVETIGWSIGWLIWRTLTFGRFPETGLGDIDETPWWVALLVELTGLLALVLLVWGLASYLG